MSDVLSRKTVRHQLIRARNARIAEHRDDRWPMQLHMSTETLSELLLDGDPDEQHTLDFEGFEFMGIPIEYDARLDPGVVAIVWPAKKKEVSGG